MKKLYTAEEKANPRNFGVVEGYVTFSQKAQKHLVALFVKKADERDMTETDLLAKHGFASSGMASFKKAGTKDGQDRSMYQSSVERMATMLGFPDVISMFKSIDTTSAPTDSSGSMKATNGIDTSQRVYAVGAGTTIIRSGKNQIVLHDANADIRKGDNGETIVDVG